MVSFFLKASCFGRGKLFASVSFLPPFSRCTGIWLTDFKNERFVEIFIWKSSFKLKFLSSLFPAGPRLNPSRSLDRLDRLSLLRRLKIGVFVFSERCFFSCVSSLFKSTVASKLLRYDTFGLSCSSWWRIGFSSSFSLDFDGFGGDDLLFWAVFSSFLGNFGIFNSDRNFFRVGFYSTFQFSDIFGNLVVFSWLHCCYTLQQVKKLALCQLRLILVVGGSGPDLANFLIILDK